MKTDRTGKERKPYEKPVLKIYGDLRHLTTAVASTTPAADGGTGKTNKTA